MALCLNDSETASGLFNRLLAYTRQLFRWKEYFIDIVLVEVYAPTSSSIEEDFRRFYEDMNLTMKSKSQSHCNNSGAHNFIFHDF